MCLPAVAAIPLLAASTAISTVGTVIGAIGQANQANYQAKVNEQNAKLASQQAADAISNTNLEAQRRARALAATKGAQLAALAANGVDLNFGSAVDIQKDTAMIGNEDLSQIYRAGKARAEGYDISSFNYRSEAASNRAAASGAIFGGIAGGLGTALGGASQIAVLRKQGF